MTPINDFMEVDFISDEHIEEFMPIESIHEAEHWFNPAKSLRLLTMPRFLNCLYADSLWNANNPIPLRACLDILSMAESSPRSLILTTLQIKYRFKLTPEAIELANNIYSIGEAQGIIDVMTTVQRSAKLGDPKATAQFLLLKQIHLTERDDEDPEKGLQILLSEEAGLVDDSGNVVFLDDKRKKKVESD